jgi:hypothetical protein
VRQTLSRPLVTEQFRQALLDAFAEPVVVARGFDPSSLSMSEIEWTGVAVDRLRWVRCGYG